MLDNCKKEVLRIAQTAERKGLCITNSGNFSMRDVETGYILITPSHVSRENMSYDDICVLDIDGNIIESKNGRRPSSEVLMHLEIYKMREDINGIAHTHSKFATAFAVMNKPIPPIVYEASAYGGTINVSPYRSPGTKELAESIKDTLSKSNATLLQSHGAVSLGSDIEEALLNSFYVEDVAEIYWRILTVTGGKEPPIISQVEFDKWKYPDQILFK